jgi:hypothetical protein
VHVVSLAYCPSTDHGIATRELGGGLVLSVHFQTRTHASQKCLKKGKCEDTFHGHKETAGVQSFGTPTNRLQIMSTTSPRRTSSHKAASQVRVRDRPATSLVDSHERSVCVLFVQ